MTTLPATPDPGSSLTERMSRLGVRESDLEEAFVKSGGHGGQNVNKTSTCVVLVHRPTKLQVKCQATRHQGRNRELALRLLLDKIEKERARRIATERSKAEKVRRQTLKRSRSSKERMLAEKARRSEKKYGRRQTRDDWG